MERKANQWDPGRVPKTCRGCGATESLVPSDRPDLLACALCGTYHKYLPSK
jgi:hypothetical protein